MNLPVSRSITSEEYSHLLDHACEEPDFAYIGSVGSGESRGVICGFSACAYRSLEISPGRSAAADLRKLAGQMEEASRHYAMPKNEAGEHLTGGWIGFLGYELGYVKEKRLIDQCPDVDVPLMHAGLYLWSASHNRASDSYYLWVHPDCPGKIRRKLQDWLTGDPASPDEGWRMPTPFTPTQSRDEFVASVAAVRQYIEAGDCYQANLSQEFKGRYSGNPWQAFRALSDANPTPYSAFIRTGRHSILSISPERFLEIRGKTVHTSPIKGTRPRGATPEQDAALADELRASEKDRAENLMIVDLLRNDLGVSAVTGTVAVDQLFALESYRNVHHLVSHIHATLKEHVSPIKALLDAFPGGSITGAPKIRAMEIIRELEPHWRGPYCGSVFYWGLNGVLDSNIAIRTLLCDNEGTIRCWGGGGIVADSDPQAEYEETLTKVRPLMEFLERLEL
ncbi:aminodeoxychorismate synthase component I [Marinobacter sp. GN3S48]|uniref:aminodeoxychorismate synthase component I n=1 Tax=Marinobacter sp. GN3S48 TaxID=3382302 RepID=UPI00387A9E40